MKKNNSAIIVAIVGIVLIIIALIILLVVTIKGKFNFNFNFINSFTRKATTLIVDESYEEVDSIIINNEGGDIVINYSDNNLTTVKLYGEDGETNTTSYMDIGGLHIDTSLENKFLQSNILTVVELYIPKEYDGKIVIKSNLGDIDIEEFKDAEFDIKLDLGDLKIKGASKLEASLDCGNMNINNIYNYISLSSSLGDITIDNLNLTRSSKINSSCGDITINNTNEIYFDIEVDLGDQKVNNNYRKSDIILEIESSLGDVEIRN